MTTAARHYTRKAPMIPAIDRRSLTPAQRDVLAAALREYWTWADKRARTAAHPKNREDGVWRAFVAAELLEMFV